MDPTPVAQTPAAADTPSSAGTSTSPAPTAYKLVKVRKADGTLATVRRKTSPGDDPTTPAPAQDAPADTGASATPGVAPKFKIVTVRKADGTLVKVRRPIASAAEDADNAKTAPRDATTQKVKPTTTIAEAKPRVVESAPTAAPAVLRSVPEDSKARPVAPGPTIDTKASPAVGPAAADADKTNADNGTSDPRATERELADALAEQAIYNRQKRTHRFKSSLMRGFGMAVGSALPSLEISHDFEDGDEIMSDDDDWSVDDGDDDGDGHDVDEHDISDERHSSSDGDHGAAHDADNSGTHVTFDAGAALGGIAATAAANAAAQPPPPPPTQAAARAAQNGATTASDPEKEKHTYKITAKELADIEKASTEKVTEKKLNRHFANMTFYFMASLSIVLPSLFIMLAGFIGGMKDKPVTSSWSMIENPIKVAISAWPIVFAAVVAQCFKAWATFKVERGIKLMELEQLVGSSSFASAMKQPILLRRMDLLTIALFGVWCLSPIGSQALVRVYTTERQLINDNATVRMIPSYGANRLLTPDANYTRLADLEEYAEVVQLMASYYISALSPDPSTKTYSSDSFLHPLLLDSSNNTFAAYGALLTYPDSKLLNDAAYDSDYASSTKSEKANPNPKYEVLNFNITYSYFSFICSPWQNKTRRDLNQMVDENSQIYISWSDSDTMGVAFTPAVLNITDETPVDKSDLSPFFDVTAIRFASANAPHSDKNKNRTTEDWAVDLDFEFSYIECNLTQEFKEGDVMCYTEENTSSSISSPSSELPECFTYEQRQIPAERITPNMTTKVVDFADLLVAGNPGGNSVLLNSPATLSEVYLQTGMTVGGDTKSSYGGLVLSANITEEEFATRFGFLFNTIMGMGYCPECVNKVMTGWVDNGTDWSKLYRDVVADREYARDLKYVVNPGWLAGFSVCAAILFLAGVAGVAVESMTVAPDVLGYVSTVARNSRYLQLPKVSSAMSGGERAKTMGGVKVMMQDVKGNANVGKIALGLKHEQAKRLVPGRLYR